MKKPSVADLVEAAIEKAGKVVPVARIVSDIRLAKPACEHTDDELAQLIAVVAVHKGRSVSFLRLAAAPIPPGPEPCLNSLIHSPATK